MENRCGTGKSGKMLLLIALLLFLPCVCAGELKYPPAIQEISANVKLAAGGTISGELSGGTVKIRVLSFPESREQKISSLKQTLEINGQAVEAGTETDSYGNSYAVFELAAAGEFTYSIEAVVHRGVAPKYLQDFNLGSGISEQGQYLNATKYIQSDSATIRTLALNRFQSSSWLETVADVADWTHNYITYDISYYPETYSAIETLESRRGTCDEFAALSAAILRAKGIPTRIIVGPVFSAEQWNFHGWLEAYNPSSGWIAVDSTYGEAGIVDATHIEMGRFPDFSDAADTINAPATASVEMGPKTIEVELIDSNLFSGIISVKAENARMYANSWQDLNVVVENMMYSYLIAPVEIAMPVGFEVDAKSRVMLLKPLEKKAVSWKTLLMKDLGKNQYLEGKYIILSLLPGIERTVRVLPEESAAEGAKIEVRDLFSFIEGNALKIELSLENRGIEAREVEIVLKNEDKEVKRMAESLGAFERKAVTIIIEHYSAKPYDISVSGDGMVYNATIVPAEAIAGGARALGNKPAESKPAVLDGILDGQTIILGVMIFAVIAILLLLKELVFK